MIGVTGVTRLPTGRPPVAVIGSGYVGTVVAACLVSLGCDVVAVEADAPRCERLARADPPFHEPVSVSCSRNRWRPGDCGSRPASPRGSTRPVSCSSALGPRRAARRSEMTASARRVEIGCHLRSPHVLVTKSTVPIGSGHWLTAAVEDAYTGDRPVDELLSVVSCPEFLREGSAISDFLHPDRVVLGSDDPVATVLVRAVDRPVLEQSFPGGRSDVLPAASPPAW